MMRGNTKAMICLSVTVFMSAAQGCSVKEDRKMCPCLLTVSAGCRDAGAVEIRIGAETETVMPSGDAAVLMKEVDKGTVRLCALQGHSPERVSGDMLTIPEGYGSDRMYIWTEEVDCRGETAAADGRLRKEFAELSVQVSDMPAGDWDMEVRGSTSGYDLSAGCPIGGSLTTLTDEADGQFLAVLPRQTGEVTLVLRNNGQENRSYRLSPLLESAGYDWEKEDLDDIRVEIEYGMTSIRLVITDWTTGDTTEIIF